MLGVTSSKKASAAQSRAIQSQNAEEQQNYACVASPDADVSLLGGCALPAQQGCVAPAGYRRCASVADIDIDERQGRTAASK
jgi:hypothetical protein